MSEDNQGKKEMTIDELAIMINNGFNNTTEKINQSMDEKLGQFKSELKTEIAEIRTIVEEVKSDTENIKANLNKKVDKIDHNSFKFRIEKLEEKLA